LDDEDEEEPLLPLLLPLELPLLPLELPLLPLLPLVLPLLPPPLLVLTAHSAAFPHEPGLPPPLPQAARIKANNKGEYRLFMLFILRTEIPEPARVPAIGLMSATQKATWFHLSSRCNAAAQWYMSQIIDVAAG